MLCCAYFAVLTRDELRVPELNVQMLMLKLLTLHGSCSCPSGGKDIGRMIP